MDLASWIAGRERAALVRVRLCGLCLFGALLAATAWLGWREARLAGLPAATRTDMATQMVTGVKLRLKQLSMLIYLAKVRQNSLTMTVTGRFDVDAPCVKAGNLMNLPDDSPCASRWKQSLRLLWVAALGTDAPQVPPDLERDPWGSPYLLGQSEAVCGHSGTWCPQDTIRSPGPDGEGDSHDDIAESVPQHLGPAAAAQAGK